MTKKILSVLLFLSPCLAFAQNDGVEGAVENMKLDKYEEKLKIDLKKRVRIREEVGKEIDGVRSIEHGDPCLIEPSLPVCGPAQ